MRVWVSACARLDLHLDLSVCAFGFLQMRLFGFASYEHFDFCICAFGSAHVRVWICATVRLDLRKCAFGYAHVHVWSGWICAE